jgi:Asp-tRNA(Asn)/Glu-tRNA(Gln) amidotransferase A subunit family amidase
MPYRSSLCLMVSMVRDGAISPVELVEAHLRQIERRNPQINAFVMVLAEQARAEARARETALARGEQQGMLAGIPVTVKDSFDIAGLPTETGSRLRKGHRAAHDSWVVARLRAEGAILLGKTNTPELLANYETDNSITGRTNHPLDPERTPGGSSGGEAAAIAACCSAGGVGTDGGGSIRVPAHFCGIFGLKPTQGRIPATGHFPVIGHPSGLLTVAGPMARTARDLQLLYIILAGYDPQDPFSAPVPLRKPESLRVRLGVWEQFYAVPADPEIRAAVRRAAILLEGIGTPVEPFAPRGLERSPNVWSFLFNRWPHAATCKLLEGREDEIHWTLREYLGGTEPSAEEAYLQMAMRDRMRASFLRQMEGLSALIMPVCGITAFRHRERRYQVEDREIGLFQAMMPALMANVLGLPAVTIPMAVSKSGLPIGVQLVGRPYEEELLLDLAVELEEARGPLPYDGAEAVRAS